MRSVPSLHRLHCSLWMLVMVLAVFHATTVHAAAPNGGGAAGADCAPNAITLLEPLPMPGGKSQKCINPSASTFGVINEYLQPIFAWMVGIAAGLAVLMVMIGGLQIIMSNGDQGKIGGRSA